MRKRRLAALLLALSLLATVAIRGDEDEVVSFNKESRKFHCVTCEWAKKCTKNCVKITRADALARDGKACKSCGGSCGE